MAVKRQAAKKQPAKKRAANKPAANKHAAKMPANKHAANKESVTTTATAASARRSRKAASPPRRRGGNDDEIGPFEGFPKRAVGFLRALTTDNSKRYFDAHRADYDEGLLAPGRALVVALGARLQQRVAPTVQAVPRIGGSIFRIHRDTRFSADKSPYKTHFDLWFWDGPLDGKSWGRSGFFFRLTGDALMLGVGLHGFEPDMLARYRAKVDDDKSGRALVAAVDAVTRAGATVGGEELVRVPKPYDAAHPRGALLRHKGMHAAFEGPHPRELGDATLVDYVVDRWVRLAPLHGWLMTHLVH